MVVAVASRRCLGAELRTDVRLTRREAPVTSSVQRLTSLEWALSCPLRVGGKVAGRSLVRSVAMSGGVDIQPAAKFRLIQRGEKVMDIANEINERQRQRTWNMRSRTESNERMIIYGGREGNQLRRLPRSKTLIGHSPSARCPERAFRCRYCFDARSRSAERDGSSKMGGCSGSGVGLSPPLMAMPLISSSPLPHLWRAARSR